MIKKTKLYSVVSAFIAIIMMISVVTFAETSEANANQTSDWTSKAWSRLYEGQDFQHDKNLTRAEIVALINAFFDIKGHGEISFIDVPDDASYYKEVAKAFNAGYIKGRSDDIFDPEGEVYKIEAYIILARVLKLDLDKQANQMQRFKDADEVPSWAIGAVEVLTEQGIIGDKNKIKPFEKVIGSEVVELLGKLLPGTETNEEAPKQEEKGGGKSPLNLQGVFSVAIDDNRSIDLGTIEDEVSSEELIIKLVFDRGVIREYWENNKDQIKLQANNGEIIDSEVFKIDGVEEEKSHIFIKPLENLKSGKTVNIVIGKDLKANNGNSLGKDIIITFTIK